MSCTKCKKKQEREMMMKEVDRIESYIKIGLLIVASLAIYGVVSLISSL